MSDPQQLLLFGGEPPPVRAAEAGDDLRALAARVPGRIRLGTSSWSFPGWHGIVYADRESEAVLARHGLAAYAQHPLLRAVGLDRTFYAPLRAADYARYAAQVPDDFRFLVKAPQDVTSAGSPRFLDALFAAEAAAGPAAEGLGAKLGVLLFQFPPRTPLEPERLARFLGALPQGLPVAVEIRDAALVGAAYAAALRDAGAVTSYVVHPSMPPLAEQARAVPPARGPVVVRWMLGHGRAYEAARDLYALFDRLAEPDEDTRRAIVSLAGSTPHEVLVIANNKAEGSAPRSVAALARALAGPDRRAVYEHAGPVSPAGGA